MGAQLFRGLFASSDRSQLPVSAVRTAERVRCGVWGAPVRLHPPYGLRPGSDGSASGGPPPSRTPAPGIGKRSGPRSGVPCFPLHRLWGRGWENRHAKAALFTVSGRVTVSTRAAAPPGGLHHWCGCEGWLRPRRKHGRSPPPCSRVRANGSTRDLTLHCHVRPPPFDLIRADNFSSFSSSCSTRSAR